MQPADADKKEEQIQPKTQETGGGKKNAESGEVGKKAEKEDEEANEGVKILQEVFDTKASVSTEDKSNDSTTHGQSSDASSEGKDSNKEEEKTS